ncbi:uncharacterized protein TNIN_427871 [Trichonephila inaurata madagascariensis]|uniref:Uncharacterized protein n=1 Tax=Trichonephila inaurata madagascariensis TaxID=2747483 RepID=A0A8X6IDY6_9ARAC|nr:uncharacterized protein TNIN_427871 [Trichonephila inaurata madagascariensis]
MQQEKDVFFPSPDSPAVSICALFSEKDVRHNGCGEDRKNIRPPMLAIEARNDRDIRAAVRSITKDNEKRIRNNNSNTKRESWVSKLKRKSKAPRFNRKTISEREWGGLLGDPSPVMSVTGPGINCQNENHENVPLP